jgi:nucleoside phosphorylase
VASSDRLVKNANLARQWQQNHRDLAAIEMEAAGACAAAHDQNAKLIVIRGISDIVGLKRQRVWTKFACNSAAAFAHALLKSDALLPAT